MVYRAEDTRLGRHVALKFLPRDIAKDPAALRRFRREAQTASLLTHPYICTLYDLGEHEDIPFLVLELLKGSTLKERMGEGQIFGRTTWNRIVNFTGPSELLGSIVPVKITRSYRNSLLGELSGNIGS